MAPPEVVAAYTGLQNAVLDDVAAQVRAAWTSLDDLSDEAGEAAIARVLPSVGAGQNLIAQVVTDYTARVVGLPLLPPEVALLIAAADWNRSPLLQARRLMSEGVLIQEALEQAAARAAQVHSGDVLRARNDAASALGDGLEPVRPVRYTKVPLPDACNWCREVATRLYYRADGMPVHLHCRCGVNPVTPEEAATGPWTNASTVFANYRWRTRVSTQELRDIQVRMAESAEVRAVAATNSMFAQAA